MKKLNRTLSIALSALMVLALLAGCNNSSSSSGGNQPTQAPAANVLKIGVFQPLTGENGGGGLQELYGIQYANSLFPTVNVGGVEYTIQLVVRDNKSDKTEAPLAAQSLVAEGVVIVVGTYGSGTAIAGGPIFEDAQIPAVGASCTNPQVTIGNDYYFRICFLDPFQGTVMANYAINNGYKTAAVVSQVGDDYTSGLANFFINAFTALGGEIVSEQQFQKDATDFKSILTNIKAADPDFIFSPSSQTVAPLFIKQARELNITTPIGAGDTWDNETILENLDGEAEGVVFSTFFDEAYTESDIAANFVTGFRQYLADEGHGEGAISAFSALGYDSYLVARAALEAAGSLEGPVIRDALAALVFEGCVTGTVKFDAIGDAEKDMAFIKIVKDGRFQFLDVVTIS